MNNPKKILIIGGDSFIARYFIKNNASIYQIRAISRIATGFENELVLQDFFSLKSEEFNNVDVVINFAAIVHNPHNTNEKLYLRINFELPQFLSEKAKAHKINYFLQMSTVAVYGRTEIINQETSEAPVTLYGKSKLMADRSLLLMADKNFKPAIFRSAMVYGGGNAPGNMMRLIRMVDKGWPLPFNNAHNKRDFIHISTLTMLIDHAIKNEITGVCLLCDGIPVSIRELIKVIEKCLKKKIRLFSLPKIFISIIKAAKPGLFEKLFGSLQVSDTDIRNKFNIVPKDMLEQGITEMVASYKNQK
ncbi:MAG: hypothetical protein A2275_18020 [Bacteroidetes bacterium RIFOXYA12_FULL_35_11]|nr:MAG: hypothetical protein A2X01_04745 [Bacteroidetes bacterium GWF2_35_48]OFY72491.1 MAG: hypothetical protein A2275_18020 [Bacteroidetes bacterium RIFOXYA12_FULL_35_11]OFY97364.1 MAG: hypothetical protein A2309_14300 [Bacteroidetes bacterium RIFOXYB2_FULL_35_7]OFZ00931.1 MAG: hypothetical protein A2491_04105 [Bacteroidetes bacterium RIFOXYC12_FULL_35_7]HBX51984.1 hypothetical protein [Bacteroidales bacterium]